MLAFDMACLFQDLLTCLKRVYMGEVTATFYDAPIVQAAISSSFLQSGKCGLNGGYCSEWDIAAKSCNCHKPGCNGTCEQELDASCNLTYTPLQSSLQMVSPQTLVGTL